MSIGVAGINADIASLIPELKKDIGEAVSTEFQLYSSDAKKLTINFQAGELAIYNPEWERPSLTRFGGGDPFAADPNYKTEYCDVLKIMAEYYSNSVIQWKTLNENTTPVGPTKTWPKDVYTKCFQRGLIHKNFEIAKRFVKLGADTKKYFGEQSMQSPSYSGGDFVPEYAEGATTLHWACERPCLESLKFLKEIGVWDLTAKDAGDRTPLHYLLTALPYRGFPEVRVPMLKLILEDPQAEKIVNAKTKKGNTPLNCMFQQNFDIDEIHPIVAAYLEYSPVKVDLQSVIVSNRQTPSEYCAASGLYNTASLLDSYKGPTKAAPPAKPAAKPAAKLAAKPSAGAGAKPAAAAAAAATEEDLDKLLANLQSEVGISTPAKPAAKTAPGAKPTATATKPAAASTTAKPAATSAGGVSAAEHEKLKKKVVILQNMLEIVVGQLQFNPSLNKLVYELQKLDKE